MDAFREAYNSLNPEQKRAVDTIEGPVMVVAGPGTGKTQVLSLRIAHILTKTDTTADSILCLTFTNAGVKAMRERLLTFIGAEATKVRVATFHSFGMQLLEKYYMSLGLPSVPALLDDAMSVAFLDELFTSRDWERLRPRANPTMYFRDLKSLISLLKRENISPDAFRKSVADAIESLNNDPENISTRGESKGALKKEIEKKIEGLERSLEIADFYALYESVKAQRTVIDYDDVLTLMVALVRGNDDVRADIREQYQYILIDEHQDSTGVQNEFLETVWKNSDQPNMFVVGDDRQLIYGFGGASLAYFEQFKHLFGKATLITLHSNYRSTQVILDAADVLLQSELAEGKLEGNTAEKHPIALVEAEYPREEIIAAGLAIKEKIKEGISADNCAILMPKNRQVKAATQILRSMGIAVAAENTLRLFDLPETDILLLVLRLLNDPFDAISLTRSILDPLSGISPMNAHTFLHESDTRTLSLATLAESSIQEIKNWGTKLETWMNDAQTNDVYGLIQIIGNDLLLHSAPDDETIRRRVEIIRTFLNLVSSFVERGKKVTLGNFLQFVDRLREYDEDIPLAVFAAHRGVKVLTFHGSKGLEFDVVWIAHMDERSLMGTRRQAFALPESILERIEEHDEAVAKRQLYVAITRARRFCTISFAHFSHTGADQQLAGIIAALPEGLFERQPLDTTEQIFLNDPQQYVARSRAPDEDSVQFLKEAVAEEYTSRNVSVTLLNNFFECPWKWYFRNLLQLPEPLTESLHLGNVVHKAIECVLKKKETSEDKLKAYIAQCAQSEARYQEHLGRRLTKEASAIMNNWLARYSDLLKTTYEIERSVFYHDPSFSSLTLYGKIDLVEELSSGNVRVTDWKTGSPKTKTEIEKTDEEGRMSSLLRQLAMYVYLIEGSTKDAVSVEDTRLVFVEAPNQKNATISHKVETEDVERLRNDIKDYKRLIETGEWMQRPCCKKKYGEDDECEYCAMAERFGVLKREKY
ncbi:MAG TPA: ATP-dependent DNA helicase [Candidatus Paceibacterota bacterium]|nr:ATP-dependent DNA helicase [Candidatus Paceibacterota bacterium]